MADIEKLLKDCSSKFHKILSCLRAREALAEKAGSLPTPVYEGLLEMSITGDAMAKLCIDGFSDCVMELVKMGASDVSFHECRLDEECSYCGDRTLPKKRSGKENALFCFDNVGCEERKTKKSEDTLSVAKRVIYVEIETEGEVLTIESLQEAIGTKGKVINIEELEPCDACGGLESHEKGCYLSMSNLLSR